MMPLTHIQNTCDRTIWDDFIQKHSKSTVFQSRAYYETHKNNQNTDALALFVFDAKGTLLALMVGVVLKSSFGLISARCVVQSGPLCLAGFECELDALIAEFNTQIKPKAILTQIRNGFSPESIKSAFLKNNYTFDEHLNVIVDLDLTEIALFSTLHVHRKRNIRKATKVLSFRQLEEKLEIEESYKILQTNYKQYRLPLISNELFVALFQQLAPAKQMFVFGVYHQDKLIGTLYALANQKTLYCWYACSLKSYYKLYPNDFLHWEVFRWGIQNNFTSFDFGGAGKPNKKYGVRDFKMQFGGTVTNYGRFVNIHHPILYKFAQIGFSILQFIKIKI